MAAEVGTQAIDRAGELLVRIIESGRPVAVSELAKGSGLPKSTTSRLIGALERRGLVQRAGDRRLSPGPVLVRFAHRDTGDSLVDLAAPALERLARATGETINLAVPSPLGAEHLVQRDSAHFVGVTNWVGRRVPNHLAANGKVFLAFRAVELDAAAGDLAGELGLVRRRGYATSIDEIELGLSALAAPVFAASGDAVAALSISGPSARLTRERIATLAPLLIEEAAQVASCLGHRDHQRGAA
jgi:IclR family acetate operon transcriptional repressor